MNAAKLADGEQPTGKSLLDNDLNRQIVKALRADGRTPFSEIAQNLDVSEGTIRNRVHAMKSAGVLRITAISDPAAENYRTQAMLGLKIAAGHDPAATAERLSAIEEIIYVTWVSGRYDLLVEVIGTREAALLDLLSTHIHGHNDIAAVEVMTGLKNFKNQFLLKSKWT